MNINFLRSVLQCYEHSFLSLESNAPSPFQPPVVSEITYEANTFFRRVTAVCCFGRSQQSFVLVTRFKQNLDKCGVTVSIHKWTQCLVLSLWAFEIFRIKHKCHGEWPLWGYINYARRDFRQFAPSFFSSCNWIHRVLIFPIKKSHGLCLLWYKSLRPRPASRDLWSYLYLNKWKNISGHCSLQMKSDRYSKSYVKYFPPSVSNRRVYGEKTGVHNGPSYQSFHSVLVFENLKDQTIIGRKIRIFVFDYVWKTILLDT